MLQVHILQNQLKYVKSQMNNMSNSGLPNCQIELIKEIFQAAKVKNTKNRKYSKNWMLLCWLVNSSY